MAKIQVDGVSMPEGTAVGEFVVGMFSGRKFARYPGDSDWMCLSPLGQIAPKYVHDTLEGHTEDSKNVNWLYPPEKTGSAAQQGAEKDKQ